ALVMATVAWALSGDPVRAVAVLVVATPCPLLLAAPIAIVSGMSRCAKRGVIVKDGGALEQLARGRVLLFDKTGTITRGEATVADVVVAPSWMDRSPSSSRSTVWTRVRFFWTIRCATMQPGRSGDCAARECTARCS
ncbi:MAG TPA: hypothetical protein VHP57_03865, partial [Acidimicrobiia bacterium]|nr:hypothetical protein [Acidimicrobiia bacterium]